MRTEATSYYSEGASRDCGGQHDVALVAAASDRCSEKQLLLFELQLSRTQCLCVRSRAQC